MKKKITFDKKIEFSTMIGEITAISLEEDLKFIDSANIEGNLQLTGKYKMTEASRLEQDFNYEIPIEIALNENLNLNNSSIEITDFNYEIEENNLICHIELGIDGLELIESEQIDENMRECDGETVVEEKIEMPVVEEESEEDNERNINSLFSNLDDDSDTYGTLLVYIVRQNETINSIIEKYNTSLEELEKYNDLNEISIGTKLIIPILNE